MGLKVYMQSDIFNIYTITEHRLRFVHDLTDCQVIKSNRCKMHVISCVDILMFC